MNSKNPLLILFCAINLLFAAVSLGAVQEEKKAEAKQPMVITSDGGLFLDYAKNIAVFNKNVVIKDAQGMMKADEIKIYFNPKSSSIAKIEAFGNVFIDQGERKSESQKVLMFPSEGKIILTGSPKIKQGNDIYSAEKITILRKNNQVIFEPNAKLVIFQEGQGEIF